ncbi:MAG: GNAT family N-acetyltransferase [Cocleimonas sp.]
MDKLIIRKARKEDANSVSYLLKQLGYDTALLSVEEMLLNLSTDNNEIYVCELKEQIIAVMSIIFFDYFPSAQKLCRITALIVDEENRGSGIGSKLINFAKSVALSKKCSVLEVTTSLEREQTQKYYEDIGFEKTSYKYVLKL